jgi:hypothetical protein
MYIELNGITDLNARQRRLVELNVIEQCLNIFKTAVVQRKRVETHKLIDDPDSTVLFTGYFIVGLFYYIYSFLFVRLFFFT